MTLAEDLVTAAAQAICQIYDKSVTEASLPVIHATRPGEWTPEAAAAVYAVLARLQLEGYGYLVSARTDGPRRRHLWRLARDIGDPGVPQAEKPQP